MVVGWVVPDFSCWAVLLRKHVVCTGAEYFFFLPLFYVGCLFVFRCRVFVVVCVCCVGVCCCCVDVVLCLRLLLCLCVFVVLLIFVVC